LQRGREAAAAAGGDDETRPGLGRALVRRVAAARAGLQAAGRTALGGAARRPRPPPEPRGRVAVVGAGVSGLTAAYRLQQLGFRVTVFESAGSAGGGVRSFAEDGFLWEAGPGFLAAPSPAVTRLVRELGLARQRLWPKNGESVHVVRSDRVVRVPTSLPGLALSPLLSARAKAALLLEPVLWRRSRKAPRLELIEDAAGQAPGAGPPEADEEPRFRATAAEETVREFCRRHCPAEAVDFLVDPLLSGPYGVSLDDLSARHALPAPWALDRRFGSVAAGRLAAGLVPPQLAARALGPEEPPRSQRTGVSAAERMAAGAGRPAGVRRALNVGAFSFQGGMQALTDALLRKVGPANVRLGCAVEALE